MGRPRKMNEEETPAVEETPAAEERAAEPAQAGPAKPPKTKAERVLGRGKRARAKRAAKPARGKEKGERAPLVRLPKPERERGQRKERRGVVVSSAMDKTIVVRVDTVKPHPRYKKVVRRSTRLHAHDEANVAKPGDLVRVIETRPLSKTKNWRLAEVLEEAR